MKTRFSEPARRLSANRAVTCALALLVLLAWGSVSLAQNNAVIKLYSCTAGSVQATADQLRTEFGALPDVRIAADERTSQVIVQAPPEIQARVSQRMTAVAPPSGDSRSDGNADPSARAAARDTANQTRSVQLQHRAGDQIEASLWSMLGNRLAALPAQRLQTNRYRVALSGGGNLELTIDAASKQVTVEGLPSAVDSCVRLIQVLDAAEDGARNTRVIPLRTSKPASIQRAAAVIRDATSAGQSRLPMVATLFQAGDQRETPPPTRLAAAAPKPPAPPAPAAAAPAAKGALEQRPGGGLVGPVQIEMIEGLDIIVLRGNAADVEQVQKIISQIEAESQKTQPVIEVLPLQYVDCQAMAAMVSALYNEVYLARQGSVSITAVVKPNALLVVGRDENVKTVLELVAKLDQPVPPESQFRIFYLKNASAQMAQATIQDFYNNRVGAGMGLGVTVTVTSDPRTNALVVQASPRDLAEVADLIARIDAPSSEAVNELKVIQLEHSMAQDLMTILQSAIGAAVSGARPGVPGAPGMAPGGAAGAMGAAQGQQVTQRNAMLRFLTVDAKGQRMVQSGILNDVRITADPRTNSLIVSAPKESIELIETLVHQIDALPAAEAQIKVFTILNGDASSLAQTLQQLFLQTAAGGGGFGGFGGGMMGAAAMQTALQGVETIVPLRFAIDLRTNSIIASGSMEDLSIVEALLVRLDDSEARHRKTVVFRLKNSPATDVSNAINTFLTSERTVATMTPGAPGPFEQIASEVVVVPEPVSNSLLLTSTPRFFDEIKNIIEQLDARPPMVMIDVLIAEVDLGNTDEFGMEVGLQDGLLFDRSLLGNLVTQSITNTSPNGVQTTTTNIVGASNDPGYNFNNTQPLGNSGATNALANRTQVATQGLSNFAVGRTNANLGYGGLVMSASSESVNVLLRALSECHRAEVLQRPQIMTLDNQQAYIQVGQRVPQILNSTIAAGVVTNSVTTQNVGVILAVTPRISPDGLVVMMIDAEKSVLEPEATGIPISVSGGQVIRSPIVDNTTAQTTVSALSGQTVILGGLIANTKNESHAKVPLLGDIPLLGHLFRFDHTDGKRQELLIIMTPHIIRNEADADAIKQAEAARMSWCMCDVTKIYGEAGLRRRTDDWSDAETQVVYPDGKQPPQSAPGFESKPGGEPIPAPPSLPGDKSTTRGKPDASRPISAPTLQPAQPESAGRNDSRPAVNTTGLNSPAPAQFPAYQPTPGPGYVQPVVFEQPAAGQAASPQSPQYR